MHKSTVHLKIDRQIYAVILFTIRIPSKHTIPIILWKSRLSLFTIIHYERCWSLLTLHSNSILETSWFVSFSFGLKLQAVVEWFLIFCDDVLSIFDVIVLSSPAVKYSIIRVIVGNVDGDYMLVSIMLFQCSIVHY